MKEKTQEISKVSNRKFVQEFKGLIRQDKIAEQLGISKNLMSQIISGDRTDHYNAIEVCKKEIEEKLNRHMPVN